jgi:hypothetical protein
VICGCFAPRAADSNRSSDGPQSTSAGPVQPESNRDDSINEHASIEVAARGGPARSIAPLVNVVERRAAVSSEAFQTQNPRLLRQIRIAGRRHVLLQYRKDCCEDIPCPARVSLQKSRLCLWKASQPVFSRFFLGPVLMNFANGSMALATFASFFATACPTR